MHIRINNKLVLALIILVALFIRVYQHPHILMSDEANNMLTIKAIIEGDGVREYFFKHPPLFTIFSSIVSYPFGDNHLIVQGISIAFSIISMFPFYLIVEKVFDRRTAFLSLLTLAILPMNILYSTWIKQDAMLLFFFLWSLYFYITEKPFISGILFGIASLTKEFAFFLIPITVGWELLKAEEELKGKVKRYLMWLFTGIAISGWWYVVFGGLSFKAIDAAVKGGDLFEFSWHYPWYYYLRNSRADLTLTLVPFFLIGLMCLINLRRIRDQRLLPIIWVLAFYLPLSLMKVKAPWYTFLASPAIGMIAAVGFLKVWDMSGRIWLRWSVAALVTLLTLYNLYVFDGTRHYQWLVDRRLPVFFEKEYFGIGRGVLKGESRIAVLEYNPTLQYYLGISDKRLYYLGSQFSAMSRDRVGGLAERFGIGWFAIDMDSLNYMDKNLADLTFLYGEPKRVGNVLIFKVEKGNIP